MEPLKLKDNSIYGKVPKKEIRRFSIGIMGQNMTYGLVSQWLFYYCTDVLFIAPLFVGFIVGFSRIWDAVNDPIMGVLIDRRRFKSGEKLRPYLLYTPLLIGILSLLMFINPNFKTDLLKVAYIFVIYLLWDILYTFQDIAQWGMTSLISPFSEERTKVVQWARIGGTVGGWLPGLLPLIISFKDTLGISEATIFAICGVVIGLGGMSISLLTYSAKERIRTKKPKDKVSKSFSHLFKNKMVILLLIASLLSSITFFIPPIYFFKYKVGLTLFGIKLDGLKVMMIYTILVGLPGTLAMLFANKIAKVVKGMKNLLIIAATFDIVSRGIAFFIGYEGISLLIIVVLLGLGSLPNQLKAIASTSLWCDSIDYMELKTGQRAEAVTFAAQNLIEKAKGGIATMMGGLTLTILKFDATKFDKNLPQSEVFNKWIWFVFILGPALGSILYLIPLLFVDYSEKMRKQTETELAKIRLEKEGTEKTE